MDLRRRRKQVNIPRFFQDDANRSAPYSCGSAAVFSRIVEQLHSRSGLFRVLGLREWTVNVSVCFYCESNFIRMRGYVVSFFTSGPHLNQEPPNRKTSAVHEHLPDQLLLRTRGVCVRGQEGHPHPPSHAPPCARTFCKICAEIETELGINKRALHCCVVPQDGVAARRAGSAAGAAAAEGLPVPGHRHAEGRAGGILPPVCGALTAGNPLLTPPLT